MPIDVETAGSPGWWMQRLFNRLAFQQRQFRLWRLHNYRIGHAPLPVGAEGAREMFQAFCRQARSNFGELITGVMSERMIVVGFRTALEERETGDAEVGALWEQTGLDITSADVTDAMLALSEAYVVVGNIDEDTGAPLVTYEDPRWMVAEPDPTNPRRLLAALKVLHDDVDNTDRAYLFLPGRSGGKQVTQSGMAEVWVASRPFTGSALYQPLAEYYYDDGGYYTYMQGRGPIQSFSPQSWSWEPDRSGPLNHPRIPVVRFANKDQLGEYETHTDLLDRINHQLLQRMTIATLQAFRQRAVRGLPLKDERGEEIDYSDVFTMDPGALWQLPETAQMWESGVVDLSGILNAVKDDLQHLSAVTRTPMHMLMPSGVNQSAEGAAMQREGLVFKVRDRIARASHSWAQVISLVLLAAGKTSKADLSALRTMWARPEMLSLQEKADAAIKATNDIPRRSRLIHIWDFTPAQADRMMSEWASDALLDAQINAAAALAAAAVAPPMRGSARGAPGGGQALTEGRVLTGQDQQQGQQPQPPVQPSDTAAKTIAQLTGIPQANVPKGPAPPTATAAAES